MGDFTWTVVVALVGLAITVGGGAFKLASDQSSIRQLERLGDVIKATKEDATDANEALATLREVRNLQVKRLRANYSLGVKTREVLRCTAQLLVAVAGIVASLSAYNSALADTQFEPWLFWVQVLVVMSIAGGALALFYLFAAIFKKY